MNKKVAIIFFSLFCLLASAQDMNLFYRLVSEGEYERAKTVLEGINIINSGKYDSELKKVSSCVRLKQDALQKYKQEHFTEAIRCFEIIKGYYPSPAIDSWIKKCEQARDEYLRKKEMTIWNSAIVSDEVSAYIDYLHRYPYGAHSQEARGKIFDKYISLAYSCYNDDAYNDALMYFDKAAQYGQLSFGQKTSYEKCKEKIAEAARKKEYNKYVSLAYYCYSNKAYNDALMYFDKAAQYGQLTFDQKTSYEKCKEIIAESEEKKAFENLMNSISKNPSDIYAIRLQCNYFLKNYPNSPKSPIVRGKLVQACCNAGLFSNARNIVKMNPESVSFSSDFETDRTWWLKYIKQREKQWKKAHK